MPIRASISLETLHCIDEWDANGHSEPYVWTTFFWSDGGSVSRGLAGGDFLNTYTPLSDSSARGLLGRDVKPGDVVSIPASLGSFSVNLDDDPTYRRLGVVVALAEQDETPKSAARAGHKAFGQSLHRELNDFIRLHRRRPSDEEIQEIAHQVEGDVVAATKGAYGTGDILSDLFGANRDDFIGFDYEDIAVADPGSPLRIAAQALSMDFATSVARTVYIGGEWTVVQEPQHYEIRGHFRSMRLASVYDPCQNESEALAAAQEEVADLLLALERKRDELRRAGSNQREGIIAELDHLNDEVQAALATLASAKAQLDSCKASSGLVLAGADTDG